MYFKNLQIYRLSPEWPITLDALREQPAEAPLHSCALMVGELSRLLPALVSALGGEIQRAPDLVDQAKEAV